MKPVKKDGFEFGGISGEAAGKCKTIIIAPNSLGIAVPYIQQKRTKYVSFRENVL